MFDEIPGSELSCDTTELILMHRAFRREFGLLPRQVRRVALGDTARADVVARHATELIRSLDDHLRAADELWTELAAAGVVTPTVAVRLRRQHRSLRSLLAESHVIMPAWQSIADSTGRAELASLLTEVGAALVQHFDDTERDVLPRVRRHVRSDEWTALRERGMASLPRNRRLVFLARILEDASPDEQSGMLSHLSPPRRLEYRLIGPRRRTREDAALRRGLAFPPTL